GLLDGVDGQHTEGYRHAVFHGHLGQALGALAGDVFKVRRTATNHRAKGNDRRILAALGDFLGDQRDLEGTRRADDSDVAFLHAVADQGVDGTTDQALDDEAVEAANHQGVFALRGDEGTFDGLQGHGRVSICIKSRDALRHPVDINVERSGRPCATLARPDRSFSGQVFYYFQVETGYRIELHRRTHQAHLAHPEVTENLRTRPYRAVGSRAGGRLGLLT